MPTKIDGLSIAKQLSEIRNGKCLSTVYINSKTKMLWKCSEGHTWEARLNNIQCGNQWCPQCAMLIKASKTRLKNGR